MDFCDFLGLLLRRLGKEGLFSPRSLLAEGKRIPRAHPRRFRSPFLSAFPLFLVFFVVIGVLLVSGSADEIYLVLVVGDGT